MEKERTIYQLLLEKTRHLQKNQAVSFLGAELTYRKFIDQIDRVSWHLKRMGLKPRDAVTVCLPNIPNALVALYAINKLGCIANIIHPLVPTNQLLQLMQKTESRYVFLLDTVFKQHAQTLQKAGLTIFLCGVADYLPPIKAAAFRLINRKKLNGIVTGGNVLRYTDMLKGKPEKFAPAEGDKRCSIYLHSGGTTGSPKTVMLNDYALNNLALRGEAIIGGSGVGKGMLAVLPMFHGFGLCMCVHTMLVNGGISVLVPQFDVKMVCGIMRKGRVYFMAGVPTMYEKLLKNKKFTGRALKNLQFAFCGGDTMPLDLKKRFDQVLKESGSGAQMFEGYGLTETVTVCTVNTNEASRLGSMGKPLTDIKVKAVDLETGGDLEPGAYGELTVCGNTGMIGYLHDEAATEKVMRRDAQGDIWVRTGDMGMVDGDGYVWFKQRIKRIIKVAGVAVFPTEIEDAAMKIPGVERVCAVGVPHPTSGHTVKLIVQADGAARETDEFKRQIREKLSEDLMKWAVPREIEFIENMPLTMIGKVDFKKLS